MADLIRKCWPSGRKGLTKVHLFPMQARLYAGPDNALCGVHVPFYLRSTCPASYRQEGLITNPGPGVDARPCRRCAKFAAKAEAPP